MEKSEALKNIGQPFKWSLCVKWDVIRSVSDDGYIKGDFIEAPAEDCRLKQEQPIWLKAKNENKNLV
jgi:hypothetical protein